MTGAAGRIFISFASRDEQLTDALIDFLRLGCDLPERQVFATTRPGSLRPGASFTEAIRGALREATMSLHLLTPAYYESAFCLAELGAVWARDMPHVPLLVPPTAFADLDSVQLGEQALRIDASADLDQLHDLIRETLGIRAPIAHWNVQKEKFLRTWSERFAQSYREPDDLRDAAAHDAPAPRRGLSPSGDDVGARRRLVVQQEPIADGQPRAQGLSAIGIAELSNATVKKELAAAQVLRMACLYDSRWTEIWGDALRAFCERPGVELEAFLPDPGDSALMRSLAHRHQMDVDGFRDKVKGLARFLEDLRSTTGAVVVVHRLRDYGPSYTAYVFEGHGAPRAAVLRIYRHRMREGESLPELVIDQGALLGFVVEDFRRLRERAEVAAAAKRA